jgi:hypothetical protein
MSQLQLSLLGAPIIQHGERKLAFSTRKALALLIYLAVENKSHTRQSLSEVFWPELDAEHQRLFEAITRLLRQWAARCPLVLWRELVYQEAGAIRQRLIEQRVWLVMQEEVSNDQREKSGSVRTQQGFPMLKKGTTSGE